MAERAKRVYAADVSYGSTAFRRGHWADRVAAIDADLAAVGAHFAAAPDKRASAAAAIHAVLQPSARAAVSVKHTAPEAFRPGSDLPLMLTVGSNVSEATLWYRHVNQAERWLSMPMQRLGSGLSAAIPAVYTDSPYPLQYYFELRAGGAAALHPPFNATLSNQPYYAIHKRL
jgi:hypothetical protein